MISTYFVIRFNLNIVLGPGESEILGVIVTVSICLKFDFHLKGMTCFAVRLSGAESQVAPMPERRRKNKNSRKKERKAKQ